MTRAVLIIGGSRGIGLGLAREFARRGWRVFASERTRAPELHALAEETEGVVEVVCVDVTEEASVASLSGRLEHGSLDAIVVNAGISGARHQSVEQATSEEVAHVMMTNAVGPAAAAKRLLPLLREGGVLALMSSRMGSIADSSGGYELYRMSKAAQNILAKGIAEQDARGRGIAVLSLHPGWVQTDMGGPNATLSVEESVGGLADVIEDAGGPGYRFVDYKGEEVPF